MKTFYIAKKIDTNNGGNLAAIDYPKDLPIPNVGDELIIPDEEGFIHTGVVSKRQITIHKEFRELAIYF